MHPYRRVFTVGRASALSFSFPAPLLLHAHSALASLHRRAFFVGQASALSPFLPISIPFIHRFSLYSLYRRVFFIGGPLPCPFFFPTPLLLHACSALASLHRRAFFVGQASALSLFLPSSTPFIRRVLSLFPLPTYIFRRPSLCLVLFSFQLHSFCTPTPLLPLFTGVHFP